MYSELTMLLQGRGYKASDLKEWETCRGVAAQWNVEYHGLVIARCHDAGDGGSLSVYWRDASHKPFFKEAGFMADHHEPVETALFALSLS